jgi:hypothetical protein
VNAMSHTHVCTLFEGHYHHGVGSLINTLHAGEFDGTLWIGYRGSLPSWIDQLGAPEGEGGYLVADRFRAVFVELHTPKHFTLYKPDFMLWLIENRCPDAAAMFYFDPDILTKAPWWFFEKWVGHGVALCEDINSPMSLTSPVRAEWKAFLRERGIELAPRDPIYVNGGFVGLSAQAFPFLAEWKRIQDLIEPHLPPFGSNRPEDRYNPFGKLDQDALNIAKDLTAYPCSISDKIGMDFSIGGTIMSHATGRPKPWEKNFLSHLMATGGRPTQPDRLFFERNRHPIDLYHASPLRLASKRVNLALAAALGRLMGS